MKRHLLVTNDFPPKVGGIQNYLWELWRRLSPDSYVVLTASSDDGAAAFDAEQAERGIHIERVPEPILFFPTPGALAAVRRCAAEHEVDLVLLDPALPLGLLGPHLDLPYGVVLHGAEVTVPGRLPGSRAALGHVLRGATLVVSAGGYPAAEARRAAPDMTAPVVEIPPGVDAGTITPLEAAERRAARARLGLPVDGPLVVSVSRLVPRKGMDVLIAAAGRLAASYPELAVAIGGTAASSAGCGGWRPRARRRSTCWGGSATRTGPPCSGQPTSSSWRAATVGWAWSRRASGSSSWRRRPPACPRSPAPVGERPRPCSTG